MSPTTDGDGRAWGARLIRRRVGAVARRRTGHSIKAVTRSALERDGFDVGLVNIRDRPVRR